MPAPKVRTKWRPTLALIVYVVLLAVMALPILIVIWFRAVEASSNRMAPAEIGALVVAFMLTLGVAYVLTRTITGPIDALIARTEEIARGGKGAIQPLESYGTREIAVLSQSFLDLAGKLVDRTEYVRSFAAHFSHELKSPLTAIRGAAELLRDDDAERPMTKAQRLHFLDNIIADAVRLDALLQRLRNLRWRKRPWPRAEAASPTSYPHCANGFPPSMFPAQAIRKYRLLFPRRQPASSLPILPKTLFSTAPRCWNSEYRSMPEQPSFLSVTTAAVFPRQIANASFSRSSQPAANRAVPAWASVSSAPC